MEEERRKAPRYCEGHIALCEDIAVIKTTVLNLDKRINGSIDTIEKHIDNSRGRNLVIVLAFVGILTWLLSQGIAWGESKKQIQINTERWDRLLKNNPIIVQKI